MVALLVALPKATPRRQSLGQKQVKRLKIKFAGFFKKTRQTKIYKEYNFFKTVVYINLKQNLQQQ